MRHQQPRTAYKHLHCWKAWPFAVLLLLLSACGDDDAMLASPGGHWYAEMVTMASESDSRVDVLRLIIVDRRNGVRWSGELPFPPGTAWQWQWLSWNELEMQVDGYPPMRWRCENRCEILTPRADSTPQA